VKAIGVDTFTASSRHSFNSAACMSAMAGTSYRIRPLSSSNTSFPKC
jgi:hypothetical protein